MPRIEILRVGRWLWVAWREDDLGGRTFPRFGWSSTHAWHRCIRALGRATAGDGEPSNGN